MMLCARATKITILQFANDLRDSAIISEVHRRVCRTDNKVEDIHKYLFKSKRSGTLPSDAAVRQEIPLKPEVFYGRDDFVQDITQLLLQEETSRVCILGPGGMGKTSVSLAVVESPLIEERFPGGNLVWVPCIEATSATLLLEILYTQLQVPGDKQVTLDKIISELNASKQPRLILLDNFETPWNAPGGTQKQVGDILRRLAILSHVAILVTMRGRYPPCNQAIKWQPKDIKATDEVACLRIYHKLNPGSENDPDVPRLLAALGYMPFAVTLVAKLGVEGHSTAKDLLEDWLESGPDIFSDPEQSMNHSIRLSVESDLMKRNPNAITLLAILSLLPAGTTKENLRWWAPGLKTSMISSAMATLSQVALLVENTRENSASPVLFVVPVVQSFMQQQDRIAEKIRKQIRLSCCEFVLAYACRFDDLTFPNKSKALAAEDTNIQSILFSSPTLPHTVPSDRTMEALIVFGWHRCDTRPNLDIANHAVTAAKASGVVTYIASAVWCLGKTYHQLGSHLSSYDHLQEAYQLFNTLPPGDIALQRLSGQCAIDLVNAARMALPFEHEGEVVSLARVVEKKCAALSDDVIHGRSLVQLGAVLHRAQQPHEALCYLDQARTMLKAAGNISNLAAACQIISWVHYEQGRLLAALDAVEEAWKHAELTDSSSTQAYVSLLFGVVLFSANQDAEAWKQIEIALMKASYTGDQLNIARALEYMGYGYLHRGDYQNAYGAYEAAAERYLGTVYADTMELCKDNMTKIEQKQGNPGTVVGFYRPPLDVDKTLFYPPIQASLSELPISGS
jgi:tetratricopeptide (TPR) repeat protein